MIFNHEKVRRLREQYPPGTRVELISMEDPQAITPGSQGTVWKVDDIGSLLVHWDSGRSLNLIPGEDRFRVLSYPEQEPADGTGITMGGQTL